MIIKVLTFGLALCFGYQPVDHLDTRNGVYSGTRQDLSSAERLILSVSKDQDDDIKYNAGYRIIDFKYKTGKIEKTLTVAVWYPTDSKQKDFKYGSWWQKGKVAERAPISKKQKKYPLLIFSHGYSGGGTGYFYFTEYMARLGWIVVAPDYPDPHQFVRIRGKTKFAGVLESLKQLSDLRDVDWREKFSYRLKLLKFTIDQTLESKQFGKNIDKDKIALAGHSLGGFASICVAGLVKKYHDKRVKAVVVLSGSVHVFKDKEFKKLNIPTVYMYGESEADLLPIGALNDKDTQGEVQKTAFKNSPAPSYLLEIKGGTHFTFNNSPAFLKGTFGGKDDELELIRNYGATFLQKYVLKAADVLKNHKGFSKFEFKLTR